MSGGFLMLEIAGAAFAVDESHVVEVAEASPTTRLPFAPPHVEGVANVAGHLMPVVDVAGYPALGLGWSGGRKGGLFIVLGTDAGTLALRAGRVGGTLPSIGAPLESDEDATLPLAARFTHAGRTVHVFDPARVALGPGLTLARLAEDSALVGLAAAPLDAGKGRPNTRLLVVEAGGRGYALDMRDVVLVFAVTDLRPLPNAPAIVRGMSHVQRHPVLLVDALGTAGDAAGYGIVFATPHGPVAVRVDAVRGVVRFADDQRMSGEEKDGRVLDDIVDHDGTWLEVRSGPRMLGDHLDEIGRLIPEARDLDDSRLPQRHYRRFLTFTVGGQVYALAFERVRRVVESSDRLRLPQGGQSFDGITDVDGSILPIIDLRRLLARRPLGDGTPGAAAGKPGTAILVEIAGGNVAIVADEVQRIRKVPSDDVDPMSDRLTAAVIRLDGALIPVLRPEGLMPDTVPAQLPAGGVA